MKVVLKASLVKKRDYYVILEIDTAVLTFRNVPVILDLVGYTVKTFWRRFSPLPPNLATMSDSDNESTHTETTFRGAGSGDGADDEDDPFAGAEATQQTDYSAPPVQEELHFSRTTVKVAETETLPDIEFSVPFPAPAGGVLIGRSDKCDVVLPRDPSRGPGMQFISGSHASFISTEQGVFVVSHGTSGTFVNGKLVQQQKFSADGLYNLAVAGGPLRKGHTVTFASDNE